MNFRFAIFLIPLLVFGCSETPENLEDDQQQEISKHRLYEKLMHDGRDLAESNEYDEAILLFEQALALDTSRVEAYYALGFVHGNKCREYQVGCDKSLYYLDQVIRIDSTYRHTYYNRANYYMQMGDYKKAERDLTSQIAISKTEDPDYYGNRAVCYLELEETSAAYNDYMKACSLDRSKKSHFMDSIFFHALQYDPSFDMGESDQILK